MSSAPSKQQQQPHTIKKAVLMKSHENSLLSYHTYFILFLFYFHSPPRMDTELI